VDQNDKTAMSNTSEVFTPDRTEANWEHSEAAQALKRLQSNPRVKYIILHAPANACPACQSLAGTYPKDEAPRLPVESCSHPLGCRAFYAPYLDDIYP
jgi:DTW domain-containing protein YfiP